MVRKPGAWIQEKRGLGWGRLDRLQGGREHVRGSSQVRLPALAGERQDLFLAGLQIENAQPMVVDGERHIEVLLEHPAVLEIGHVVVGEGFAFVSAPRMVTFQPEEKPVLRIVHHPNAHETGSRLG